MPMPWTCPHCNRPTTITEDLQHASNIALQVGATRHGSLAIGWHAVRCPNPECNDLTLNVWLAPTSTSSGLGGFTVRTTKALIKPMRLRPESSAVPQPEFIPQQLREDYYEACRICNLSPKAAATLARRCLQGIIRDFWQVKERTLQKEIAGLETTVEKPLWEALDAVRRVGNIGAHMEDDVNKIIDIDPEEAEQLIGLVEILFRECYVARHERNQRLTEIVALGQQKDEARKA